MDFVQTFSHQRSVLTNLGGKLVYSESISVTLMHEKQNPYKKAGCKIFTNSYKNINMNKLISSTFLYCSSVRPVVLMYPEQEIQSGQNRGDLFFYMSLSFATLIVWCRSALLCVPTASPCRPRAQNTPAMTGIVL